MICWSCVPALCGFLPKKNKADRKVSWIFTLFLLLHSSLAVEYEEDYEDVTVNQMLAPKSQDSDTTEILNNLLKEYDKKLRPDIGGKAADCLASLWRKINKWPSER